jgi:hypothetical protein
MAWCSVKKKGTGTILHLLYLQVGLPLFNKMAKEQFHENNENGLRNSVPSEDLNSEFSSH